HDGRQPFAIDLSGRVEHSLAPSRDDLRLHIGLPQRLVPDAITGNQVPAVRGELSGYQALTAADAAYNADDGGWHVIHSTSSQFGPTPMSTLIGTAMRSPSALVISSRTRVQIASRSSRGTSK